MLDSITKFIEYFRKIPLPLLVFLGTSISLILFLPDGIAKSISVNEFRDDYRTFLGPSLLLTISLFMARLVDLILLRVENRKRITTQINHLKSLTPEEQGYLILYVNGDRNSIYVGIEDGVMGGLIAKGIVYRASSVGDALNGFAYNIQPWAKDHLTKHPELLPNPIGRPQTPREKMGLRP